MSIITLNTNLYEHQIRAVEKLSKLKVGALYMEMGTGKTRTALELIAQRINAGKADAVLWLCPCSVKATIAAELNKHLKNGIEVFTIEGIESLSSSIRLNIRLLNLVQSKKTYLIVDESNLVKNHRANRTQNIERLATYCSYKLILNGTPISKCEKDLFAQWRILDWRILGYQSFWSFAANHLVYDDRIRGKIRRVLNVDYLVEKIAPYTYQVKKNECLSLPRKNYSTWYFSLTERQFELYDYVKDEYLMLLDELQPSTIYRLFTALQHVVSGNAVVSKVSEKMRTQPIFDNPANNPRIKALMDVIQLVDDKKTIIWCKYTQEIKTISNILRKEYGENSVVEFYGEIKKKDRIKAVQEFSAAARFFIANKTCAGYGLNLQFCDYVIYYSNDWDYATRSQSEDRVHRIGQKSKVAIIDICAGHTIDERILRCLMRKEHLAESFKREIEKLKDKKDIRRWIDSAEDIH